MIMKIIEDSRALSSNGTERAREWSTGVSAEEAQPQDPPAPVHPDPEVPEKPEKRKFTAEYKLRILAEADRCTAPGEIGALLRREGLYHSNLSRWRRMRDEGTLGALAPKKRGPKEKPINPLAEKVAELERENAALKRKLKQAETIIEIQKKVSALLGIPPEGEESEGSSC